MTRRIDAPNTPADHDLRECIDGEPVQSFVVIAGAGSGKTTSLIKCLDHIVQTKGIKLIQSQRIVACITYTDVAVGEIRSDVGDSEALHVSTIHSFMWRLIEPFQSDIRCEVEKLINQRIAEWREAIAKKGSKSDTNEVRRHRIEIAIEQISSLATVRRFTYGGVGDDGDVDGDGDVEDLGAGRLGHRSMIDIACQLIMRSALLRRLIANKYPYILIDEYQDTDPKVYQALREVWRESTSSTRPIVLGLFGDPQQQIYAQGVGVVAIDSAWRVIKKPENFRSSRQVVDVVNRIRLPLDQLVQYNPRWSTDIGWDGAAFLFVLPSDQYRTLRLRAIRAWLSKQLLDGRWLNDASNDSVKELVLVHRTAAERLGFLGIYRALHDNASSKIRAGLLDGSAWMLRPFVKVLLPIYDSHVRGDSGAIVKILNKYSPHMKRLGDTQALLSLKTLRTGIGKMVSMLKGIADLRVYDVLRCALDHKIVDVGEEYSTALTKIASELENDKVPVAPDHPGQLKKASKSDKNEIQSFRSFMGCPANELLGYWTHYSGESPFSTQQGVKGAEFDRVLVIIDEHPFGAGSKKPEHMNFSYTKFFRQGAPQKVEGQAEDKSTDSISMTHRLFYVCCSRAKRDLAVAVFSEDVAGLVSAIDACGYFPAENVISSLLDVDDCRRIIEDAGGAIDSSMA